MSSKEGSITPMKDDNRILYAKGLSTTYTEVWGSLIHSDNTINLRQEFTFENMREFLLAWDNIRVLKGSCGHIDSRIISISTFPTLSVYLDKNPMIGGDECE